VLASGLLQANKNALNEKHETNVSGVVASVFSSSHSRVGGTMDGCAIKPTEASYKPT